MSQTATAPAHIVSHVGREFVDMPLAQHIPHTPFPSQCFQTVDQDGATFHVIALRVTYDMGASDTDATLTYAAEQTPLATEDHWSGEVDHSSPMWESDYAPYRPNCDVLVVNAVSRPPQGEWQRVVGRHRNPDAVATSNRWTCGVGLESQDEHRKTQTWNKQIAVTGPRTFGFMGLSDPASASEVAIDWQHAFGGEIKQPAQDQLNTNGIIKKKAGADRWDTDDRNPVGRGKDKSSGAAGPQVEVSLLNPYRAGLTQSNYPPVSFNPLGRSWLPRRTLAGTYDEAWRKTQWPLQPMDFDYGYWNCAPADQQVDFLTPGTRIHLSNLYALGSGRTPSHENWSARLPMHQLCVHAYYTDIPGVGPDVNMDLDTLVIDLGVASRTIVRTFLEQMRM